VAIAFGIECRWADGVFDDGIISKERQPGGSVA
jgi:hypothetical protein